MLELRRRRFITLLGGAAAAWPLAARAQQPARRMAHIAYLGALSPATLDPRQIEQFKAGLVENGLIDGQNISVDYLWAEASPERLRQLAGDLAQRDLDVIVTAGPQPVRAVMATGTKTPIVFAILNDPIGDGFIANLAQPGGNITGLSMAGTDLESKRLEVLKDAAPAVAKVMVPRLLLCVTGSSLICAVRHRAMIAGSPLMPNCTMNPEIRRKKRTLS